MARILSIDYGLKRCGIAATDPLQLIVSPVDTVKESELFEYIRNYIASEDVEKIVIGEPTHSDGSHTYLFSHIKGLIKKLNKEFPDIEIDLQDEALTSAKAKEVLLQSGKKKKKRAEKEEIDMISAVIILQEYLGHI